MCACVCMRLLCVKQAMRSRPVSEGNLHRLAPRFHHAPFVPEALHRRRQMQDRMHQRRAVFNSPRLLHTTFHTNSTSRRSFFLQGIGANHHPSVWNCSSWHAGCQCSRFSALVGHAWITPFGAAYAHLDDALSVDSTLFLHPEAQYHQ